MAVLPLICISLKKKLFTETLSIEKSLNALGIILCSLILLTGIGCSSIERPLKGGNEVKGSEYGAKLGMLSPAQRYAGEIMSYLLKVVLGKTGNVGMRKEWAVAGTGENLDLSNIYDIMSNSDRNIQNIMVLDPNVLDLTRTLFYYDKNLSFSKRSSGFMSFYPSAEFLALRLLFLQKMKRAEKIHLKALIEIKRTLFGMKTKPTVEDLRRTGLSIKEMHLLRQCLYNDPTLFEYLKSPFLVKSLYRTGVISLDSYTKSQVARANYRNLKCRPLGESREEGSVKISFLPSITKEFYFENVEGDLYTYGFKPTEFFFHMTEKLKNEIIVQTESLVLKRFRNSTLKGVQPDDETIFDLARDIIRDKVSFFVQDQRPMVIYPENSRETIKDVCPKADFSIVLLGKNVYLSFHINDKRDVYPAVDWMYLDITDIKHSQISEECRQIGEIIYAKIEKVIEKALKSHLNG